MKTNCWVWILFLAVRLSAQTITIEPTNQMVIVGRSAAFSAAVSGTGPFSYQWQFNGSNLPVNIITTVAGNGNPGYSAGSGLAATNARLNFPNSVAVDFYGNIFIADSGNSRIRKVDTNGIITTVVGTVAGNGNPGYSGDGGAAIFASLNDPKCIALDAFGNLFIADTFNSRVRKVDTNGIITTVAGNGTNGYSGDGGMASHAKIFWPDAVAVDNMGNLFIADYGNSAIRRVDTNGIITTVVGLGYPQGIALDLYSNIFIATGNSIVKLDANSIITGIAGFGLSFPQGVAVDTVGNVFIADYGNSVIRQVDTNGIMIAVVGNGTIGYAGDGGAATNANLSDPAGVAVDNLGNLFIADSGNNVIRKVFAFGSLPTLTLDNITTNNTGLYRVIVTGTQGSVTSSIVKLTATMLPLINSQPQPLAVTNGHPASFSVTADGSPPLAYQWFFNGTNLLASTNTILTVQNAFPDNAGAYTVVITNASGSITSNPAMLTVLPLGINAPAMLASGQFQFSFDTATGVNYTVQYSTNLTQWFPFVTLGGIGVPLTLTDPNTTSSQQRFYRIVLSPQ